MTVNYRGIDDKDSILYELKEKANEYITSDSNASLIKQGMMLECICRDYLEKTGQIGKANKNLRRINDAIHKD